MQAPRSRHDKGVQYTRGDQGAAVTESISSYWSKRLFLLRGHHSVPLPTGCNDECRFRRSFPIDTAIINSCKRFDNLHENDENFQHKAMDQAELLIKWLLAVGHGRINAVKHFLKPDDGEITGYGSQRQTSCIHQPVGGGALGVANSTSTTAVDGSILRQLSSSISQQVEEARELNDLRRQELKRLHEKDNEAKNRFAQLSKVIQKDEEYAFDGIHRPIR